MKYHIVMLSGHFIQTFSYQVVSFFFNKNVTGDKTD